MKIITILGARPQFVKAAAFSRYVQQYSDVQETIVHTDQHYDQNMSESFFRELDIPNPKYHLGCGGLSQGAMTGRMLEKVEEILKEEKPNVVMVYGDTNSTIAGALAAVKMHIPVAHVEAGLRSFNMKMPEEVNRVLTDRISDFLFCPSEKAVQNLLKEGTDEKRIFNVGDIMYEALLYYSQNIEPSVSVQKILGDISDFILCTIHRAENLNNNDKVTELFWGLDALAGEIPILLPLHPHTRSRLEAIGIKLENLRILEPVGYKDMLFLLKMCKLVMTDSGGLQKEAYFMKRPCITLREETEWVETVDVGANTLVGADIKKIRASIGKYSNTDFDFSERLYGDGKTSEKIISILLENL